MEPHGTFRDALYKMYEENTRVLIPKELYLESINNLLEASITTKKTPHHHYLLKKYEVLKCGDVDKLIKRRQSSEEDPLYFVTIEDTYDTIKRAHLATGRGGRDKMIHEINKKYANITIDSISLFKSMCTECQRKR
ncbi:KRAB-A domain-containing protein 2-like [Haliotis cracherodii]|uniref:KRAB-A domain-containing protein 2-like n=1 Tax=Haliotis cracherodii TaxID=6455 RepID=UPI0039EC7CBA